MIRTVQAIESEALGLLDTIESRQDLASWRRAHLGPSSALAVILRSLGTLPADQRPMVGRQANALKARMLAAWEDKERVLRANVSEAGVDVSLPGCPPATGRAHPITATMRRMRAAFAQMGFQVHLGREVETDEHNFGWLNMPPYHPARDSHDTFYTTRPGILLRTHTSPAQVRVMRETGVPVRAVVPGTVYRYEQPDASHNWLFNQMEGLAVGTNVHLTDLLGAIRGLVRLLFGEGTRVRFRAHYFPFTEPSIEADVECSVCGGTGCRLCKDSGWVEVIPGGMIHPTVLRHGNIDPTRFGGFAFGAGVDRIAALLYRIPDIRLLYENDVRFLAQF